MPFRPTSSLMTYLLCLSSIFSPDLAPARAADAASTVRASDFLDSIGVNSSINRRGETLQQTMNSVTYLGVRWIRAGVEGDLPVSELIDLHKQTGVRYSWGLGSGGSDIPKLLQTARELAAADALLAFEGPNEPNNWGVTYQGEKGGGRTVDGKAPSWMAVAKLQSDMYRAVKSDPVLKKYPVWGISENGAENDKVGLQFLKIPRDTGALMPDGTRYADYANVHNYVYHPNSPGLDDNKTWNASDPTPACRVDGLYGEYGVTWAKHYPGYSPADLVTLPRVTTETGSTIDGPVTEDIHALNLLSLYLDQFKRGWSATAVYLLRDRSDEAGNQQFGFYRPDYTPRKAALYLHNLTTILSDRGAVSKLGRLAYTIPNPPSTVHDLLLEKSDGTFDLVVWGEKVSGSSSITVKLDRPHANVKIYDPTLGTKPIQALTRSREVTLTLSDHPLIIAIPRS